MLKSKTVVLSNQKQMKIQIPKFKEFLLEDKNIYYREIVMSTDEGSATWLLSVGCKDAQQIENDVCYAKLSLKNLMHSVSEAPFVYSYSFGLVDRSGSVSFLTDVVKASSSDWNTGSEIQIVSRAKLMANKARFIVGDVLTIFCQIDIGGTIEMHSNVRHIERVLSDGILSDITITTLGGEIIQAHKCMLARSPVFLAMFQNGMQNSEVQVNIPHGVLKELLRFIYTDKVPKLDSIAGELLFAAEYYDLPDLKEICLKSLESNVNLNNFVNSLHISEQLEINSLKDAVLKFVVENRKDIRKSAGFLELTDNRELYQIVLEALMDF